MLAVPFDFLVEVGNRENLGQLDAAVALDSRDEVVGRYGRLLPTAAANGH